MAQFDGFATFQDVPINWPEMERREKIIWKGM
jgi:hypothetical protein